MIANVLHLTGAALLVAGVFLGCYRLAGAVEAWRIRRHPWWSREEVQR